jgi:hypothetical protein
MSQVSASTIKSISDGIDLGPTGSLQFEFAKLQMALSQMAKTNAMNYIEEIQNSQAEQKKVSDMLSEARKLQSEAGKGCTTMPKAMQDYMDKNDLKYDTTGDDNIHNKDEWEVAVQSLKAKLDELGSDTQQKMVFVQDFMGQYNSYLQGANSAIQQSNQTLSELARVR